jgi:hypothetical protein
MGDGAEKVSFTVLTCEQVRALAYAKSKGFEAMVSAFPAGANPYKQAGQTVMTWGPISGVRLAENICGVKL